MLASDHYYSRSVVWLILVFTMLISPPPTNATEAPTRVHSRSFKSINEDNLYRHDEPTRSLWKIIPSSTKDENNNYYFITVTSFIFNQHHSPPSAYIENIFGTKGVFFNFAELDDSFVYSTAKLAESMESFQSKFKAFTGPASGFTTSPPCSLEFLVMTRRFKGREVADFGLRSTPFVGHAKVFFPENAYNSTGNAVNCWYRGLHSKWSMVYHLPIAVFCPMLESTCQTFQRAVNDGNSSDKPHQFQLEMALPVNCSQWPLVGIQDSHWKAPFLPKPRLEPVFHRTYRSPLRSHTKAACLALTYKSPDKDFVDVTGAIVSEWIAHYIALGFKVIVYDSTAKFRDHIFRNNTYNAGQKLKLGLHVGKDFVYHPYSMVQLLSEPGQNYTDIVSKELQYGSLAGIIEHDKELSLTQCRFEAKAVFGIDDVLVSDFDEFLYCPAGVATDGTLSIESQRYYIDRYMNMQKDRGRQQLKSFVYIPLNNTDISGGDIQVCLKAAVREGRSIYSCWKRSTPYRRWQWMFKTIHLGLACPFTTIHESCAGTVTTPQYDCVCYDNMFELYPHLRGEHNDRYAHDTNPDYYAHWSATTVMEGEFFDIVDGPIVHYYNTPANMTNSILEIHELALNYRARKKKKSFASKNYNSSNSKIKAQRQVTMIKPQQVVRRYRAATSADATQSIVINQ